MLRSKLKALLGDEFELTKVEEGNIRGEPGYHIVCEPVPPIYLSWGDDTGSPCSLSFFVYGHEIEADAVLCGTYVDAIRSCVAGISMASSDGGSGTLDT